MAARLRLLLVLIGLLSAVHSSRAADSILKPGDFVAITGDSITEQKQYSVYIEEYLLACKPVADVKTMQFGWGGETSWGFLARVDNDCLRFKPTLLTTCFGMNDGGYSGVDPARLNKYREATTGLADAFQKIGARAVLGSPGCVDSFTAFGKDHEKAAVYNKTLAAERDAVREIAQQRNLGFADVYSPMIDVMGKAKAKYGEEYPLAGGDGVHPAANGHLVMAYAFIKALGVDGNVGTITVDLSAKKATASPGHTIQSFDNGTATVESARYPFCVLVEPKIANKPEDPNNPRGVLPFFGFNDELNRFVLVVNGAGSHAVKVTWGDATKEFPADQAGKGINLAAEFLDNPFSDAFKRLDKAVRAQQNFETVMIKNLVHGMKEQLPEESDLLERTAAALSKKQQALSKAAQDAAAQPVTHTIKVELAG